MKSKYKRNIKNKKRNAYFIILHNFIQRRGINPKDIEEVWYKELPYGFRGYKLHVETLKDGVFKTFSLKL